jgi:hypothetical protein
MREGRRCSRPLPGLHERLSFPTCRRRLPARSRFGEGRRAGNQEPRQEPRAVTLLLDSRSALRLAGMTPRLIRFMQFASLIVRSIQKIICQRHASEDVQHYESVMFALSFMFNKALQRRLKLMSNASALLQHRQPALHRCPLTAHPIERSTCVCAGANYACWSF